MSTNGISTGVLPVRDFLSMGFALSGVVTQRDPKPCYRLVFRIGLCNSSATSVRLLGRKWTLREADGNTRIIEAEKVFNARPVLKPGEVFSYGGYHETSRRPVAAEVRFFGVDQSNRPFITPPLGIPRQTLAPEA